MGHRYQFSQGAVLMPHFKFGISLFIAFAIVLIYQHTMGNLAVLIAVFLTILLIPTWFSKYVLEIDTESRSYANLIQILSYSSGKRIAFGAVEKIFINECRVAQTIHRYSTGAPATFRNVEYRAFLKLENGDKIFLLRKREADKLKKHLEDLANSLQTEIVENY